MEHFYVLSSRALLSSGAEPIYQCIGRKLLERYLQQHKDSLEDLIVGNWYEQNGRAVMGSTAYAEDYLRYRINYYK